MTKQEVKPAPFFEETWLGAAVMLSIMFLSPAIGLTLIGLGGLIYRWRKRTGAS